MKLPLLALVSLLLAACATPEGMRPAAGPPAPVEEGREASRDREDAMPAPGPVSLPAPATGSPTIGPQVRVDRGGSQFTAETSIVATDQNPDEVIAAWTDSRPADGRFSTRVGVGVSRDGGRTWEEFLMEPPAALQDRVQGDPITARDPRTGTVWVGGLTLFARERDGFFVSRKRPGAATFEPAVVVHNEEGADKPWMAAGPDPLDPEKTRLYMSHNLGLQVSEDLGDTWTAPVGLGPYTAFLPRVGPGGELYIAYWDLANGVMVRRSLDGGRTLEAPVRAAQRRDFWDFQDGSRFPGRFRVPPFTYLAVDPRDGTVYCLYFDTTSRIDDESDVDLYLTRSTDRGATWSPPWRIPENANPGDQFFPWLEVDGSGRLHLVFYDTRFTPQSDADTVGWLDAVYAWSEDGGATWTQHRLTPASFSSAQGSWDGSEFLGDYNGLTVAGNRVYPLYVSTQAGDSDVYAHTILFGDPAGLCLPSAGTLCLNQGRFRVRAEWETATGKGPGRGVALTGDSGYFWFFDASNVEVVVKVLDACAPPFNRFWVFATGLTNVGVKLTVEDTQTGAVREYLNPRNRPFQPTFDTNAFATCP
ncbi:MAG TPA: sialidase family protein [Thermoanaerobaculia bacterium]|nr:sialidase family protein [Thermoanaerobaculia bacterium]